MVGAWLILSRSCTLCLVIRFSKDLAQRLQGGQGAGQIKKKATTIAAVDSSKEGNRCIANKRIGRLCCEVIREISSGNSLRVFARILAPCFLHVPWLIIIVPAEISGGGKAD